MDSIIGKCKITDCENKVYSTPDGSLCFVHEKYQICDWCNEFCLGMHICKPVKTCDYPNCNKSTINNRKMCSTHKNLIVCLGDQCEKFVKLGASFCSKHNKCTYQKCLAKNDRYFFGKWVCAKHATKDRH